MNNSNWTGRTPRTLGQAFGPYATIHRTGRQYDRHLWIAAIALCVAVGFLLTT